MGGHRARSRSANLEATAQYRKALEFLKGLPDTPERHATELEIHLSLGLCFIAVQGYSSDETRTAFELACRLSAQIGEQRKELQAIFGLWGHFWMRADHPRAIELAEAQLTKAAQLGDLMAVIVGHRALGSTLFTLGDFVRARQHLEQAVTFGQQASSAETLSYAVDPRIAAQLMLAWDLWMLGYPDQALHQALDGLSQATQGSDVYTAAFAHYVSSAGSVVAGRIPSFLRERRSQPCPVEGASHRPLRSLFALRARMRACEIGAVGSSGVGNQGRRGRSRPKQSRIHARVHAWVARDRAEGGRRTGPCAFDPAGGIGSNERCRGTRLGG